MELIVTTGRDDTDSIMVTALLIIGVNDAGLPVGLDRDMGTLGSRPNADGYEQFLRSLAH